MPTYLDPVALLTWIIEACPPRLQASLIANVKDSLRKRAKEETGLENYHEWLDQLGEQGKRSLISGAMTRDKIKSAEKLVELLKIAGIDFSSVFAFDYVLSPWRQWPPGGKLLVYVGEYIQPVPLLGDQAAGFISSHDAHALAFTIQQFQRVVNRNGGITVDYFGMTGNACDHRYQRARVDRDEHERWIRNVAAVVSLGSPFANPASAALAEKIISDERDVQTGLYLKYDHDDIPDFPRFINSKQSDPYLLLNGKEHVVKKRKLFTYDAGVVIMNTVSRPALFVCAGIGGLGTMAATRLLWDDSLFKNQQIGEPGIFSIFFQAKARNKLPTEIKDIEIDILSVVKHPA